MIKIIDVKTEKMCGLIAFFRRNRKIGKVRLRNGENKK